MNRSWRKSKHSGANGQCVEVAWDEGVWLRDSKDPEGPVLWFTRSEWAAFIAGAKDGEFDGPPVTPPALAESGDAKPST